MSVLLAFPALTAAAVQPQKRDVCLPLLCKSFLLAEAPYLALWRNKKSFYQAHRLQLTISTEHPK
jgi:hypothetical protein